MPYVVVVFVPNITTNHAITYTCNSGIIGHCHASASECLRVRSDTHTLPFVLQNSLHLGYIRASAFGPHEQWLLPFHVSFIITHAF